MAVKIKLKNREDVFITIDQKALDVIEKDEHLRSLKILENLREHSSGYVVYQRRVTTKKGVEYETIYLHKWIAEKFIKKPKSDQKLFIRFIDGDVHNITLDNLQWVTMGTLMIIFNPLG